MSEHGGGSGGGGGILREIAAFFSIEVESEGAEHTHGVIDELIHKLHEFGEVLFGSALVEGMREFVHEQAEAGEAIANNAQILGLSTEAFQTWRYAAAQSAVSADQFNASMTLFQRNTQGAVSGNREAARAFHSLGVNVRDAHGHVRSLDELLPEVSNGFSRIEDPAERTATAVRLFGRSGAQLVAFLSTGSEGLAEMRHEVEELGGGATEDMIEHSEELIHQQRRLDLALFSLRSRIANGLLPTFTRFTEMGVQAVAAFNRLTAGTHVLAIGITALNALLVVLAIRAVAAFFAPLATAALFAVAIGIIVLVVDDLLTTLDGGSSVIRTFVDELAGVGATARYIANAIRNVTQSYQTLRELFTRDGLLGHNRDVTDLLSGLNQPTVNEPLSEEQQGEAQRRSAALRGDVQGRHGQSREDAIAEANRIRDEAGLPPIGQTLGTPGGSVTSPFGPRVGTTFSTQGPVLAPSALVPRSADVPAGGGRPGPVTINAPISISVPQGTDQQQVAAFRQIVIDVTSEQHRQTVAALGREGVE